MQRVKGTLWLLGLLCVPAMASAQTVTEVPVAEVEEENPWSADISLNQDAFFGFYPFMAGSYALSDLMDFTFYSIIWTTPGFGNQDFLGTALWTEVGVGVNFKLFDGAISVNPQLGMLNGALLSGGGTALAGEGIVPNLTVDYDGDYAEAEFYFGYYMALRGESDNKNDFIHYWAYAGVKPVAFFKPESKAAGLFTVGAHWEQLRWQRTGAAAGTDDAFNIYRWIGPYVQFALPANVALRFAAGWDLESDNGGPDFYKASVGISF